jgi:hypothetical protein
MLRKVICKDKTCSLEQPKTMPTRQVGRGGINVKSIDYLIPLKSTKSSSIKKKTQVGEGKKKVSTKKASSKSTTQSSPVKKSSKKASKKTTTKSTTLNKRSQKEK